MRMYTTTLQSPGSVPGDLVPPGGLGWELHSFIFRPDGRLVAAWVRDERPCLWCHPGPCLGPGCPIYRSSPLPQGWPHCDGTGLPGVIVAGRYGAAWLEAKTAGDNLKPAQTTWRHTLLAAGHRHHVIREIHLNDGTLDGLLGRLAGVAPNEFAPARPCG